jgi:DNA-binding NarL/FixJ family response regulator
MILKKKLVVLIASPPGDLQIGLQAILTVHMDVDLLVVGAGSSALKVIERHHPALVIIDQDIPTTSAWILVENIKTNWPELPCVVLVNDDQSRQAFIKTGADLIVIKGMPGAKLIAEIKKLVNREGSNDE